MFGLNDDNQKSNDDPAMLDNVKQLASEPASQVEPQQQTVTPEPAADTQTTSSPPPQTFTPTTPAPEPTSSSDNATDTTNTDETSSTPESNVTVDTSAQNSDTDAQTGHPEPAEGFSSQPMPTPITPDTASSETPSNGSSPAELFGNQSASDTTTDNDSSNTADTSGLPVIQSTSTPAEPSQNDVTAPPAPTPQTTEDTSATAPASTGSVNHDQLASLKQEALGHLEGLSDHLGDNPEEVFKSTMQLIQANDNHTLLEKALQAAKDIKDDKLRAKAMLDIVNEINYFSQDK